MSADNTIDLSSPDDNVIQPFQLESSSLRGRYIRLGSVLDEILDPHAYPKPVAHLVAESITLALLLSSMLKFEGIFTLQTSGDGPIKMLVSDVTSNGEVRGCASFDTERVDSAREQLEALKSPETSQNHLAQYLGKGHLAFTVDQGAKDLYQGIVDLKGSSLVDCAQHYFSQSEQIATGVKMAVGQRDGKWRAAGIMLQHMPEDDGRGDEPASNLKEDDWRRAMVLMESCTEDEFLDPSLHSNAILFRLFNEEGVRVFDAKPVIKGCRCDSDRVQTILTGMPEEDLDYMLKDGKITMTCEFCSKDFAFDKKEITDRMKQLGSGPINS